MKKEKPTLEQNNPVKDLEATKFSEGPFALNSEFTEDDGLAFSNAKEEVLFKDPDARVEIQELPDGQRSAAILNGKGKTVFFTKWEDEVSELEKYEQK